MPDKEAIDIMAKRYKDEMLRLYRMSPSHAGPPPAGRTPPPMPKPDSAVIACDSSGCRFVSPEEILGKEKETGSGKDTGGITGSDITSALLNGTGLSPESLVTSGAADRDTQPSSSSGGKADSQRFYGILLRTLYTSDSTSSDSTLSSDIYAEEIPDFLNIPPDLGDSTAVPTVPGAAYLISDRWNKLTGDSGWGYVRFDISYGEKDSPLKGATAVISRTNGGRNVLSRIISSSESGSTPTIALPAPAADGRSLCTPYAVYNVMIFANGHYPVYNMKLNIYAGINTVQPVRLAKLPEG